MDIQLLVGSTGRTLLIGPILDTQSVTGDGLAGLVYNASGLVCYYAREDQGNAAATQISLADATRGSYTSGGFKEKDATNMIGFYEFGVPTAVAASGSKRASLLFSGGANMAPFTVNLDLVALDPYTATVNLSAAAIQAIWDALTSALTTVGSIGKVLVTNVDALISSRTKPADTQAAVTTVTNLTNAPGAGDFTATMKTSLNAATPAVTVSDKTGFSLSTAGIQAIWDAATSALTTVGSIGKWILDKLDVVLSTRLATSGYTTPPTAVQNRQEMDSNSTKLDVAVSTRLASAGYTAPDNADIALIKAKTDNLPSDPADASDISSSFGTVNATLATIAGYIDTEVSAIKAKTDNLPASPAAVGSAMTLSGAYDAAKTAAQAGDAMTLTSGERTTLAGVIWASATRTLTSFGSLVADSAAAVWAAGSRTLTAFGFAVNLDSAYDAAKTAASSADYTGARAAKLDNLDAAISTRTKPADTQAAVTNLTNAPTNGDFTTAMKSSLNAATPAVTVSDKADFSLTSAYDAAKTAAQPGDIPSATENAEESLKLDWTTVTGEAARSTLNALRALRNRLVNSSGTLTVYKEDDSTSAWTGAVTTNASQDPIVEIDPS